MLDDASSSIMLRLADTSKAQRITLGAQRCRKIVYRTHLVAPHPLRFSVRLSARIEWPRRRGSRSLDMGYIRPKLVFDIFEDDELSLAGQAWFYVGDLSDNATIRDFRGWSSLSISAFSLVCSSSVTSHIIRKSIQFHAQISPRVGRHTGTPADLARATAPESIGRSSEGLPGLPGQSSPPDG